MKPLTTSVIRRVLFMSLAALAATTLAAGAASAQGAYPNKPVRLIVPFAAGGSIDTATRILAEGLGERLKTQFVVDNRPGATGIIGAQIASRAAPDGYTLVASYDGTFSILPVLQPLPFNPRQDFAPISRYADVEYVIALHPTVPARNMKELIQYTKANPGKLSYASTGIGSTTHLQSELLRLKAGLDWTHIPYGAGSGKAIMDVVAGTTPSTFISVSVASPHVAAGKLRALAVASPRRSQSLPDVPTLREEGLTGLDLVSWFGLFAPAGTPRPIIDTLNREMKSVLESPTVQKKFREVGLVPSHGTPEDLRDTVASDITKWTAIVNEANIKVEPQK